MNNKRDLIAGAVVIVAVAGTILYLKYKPKTPKIELPQPTSVEQKIENKFNIQIPDNAEKAELKDVSGQGGEGIATRMFSNGRFSLTVLANVSDPTAGTFYQAWLQRGSQGDPNFSILSLGKLRLAKGGWLLDFESSKDLRDYKQVLVTLEKVFDNRPEKHILEGSF